MGEDREEMNLNCSLNTRLIIMGEDWEEINLNCSLTPPLIIIGEDREEMNLNCSLKNPINNNWRGLGGNLLELFIKKPY